jgi:4-hydroxy-2-oxoglutarate aldolase
MNPLELHGIFPACVTPFDAEGRVDTAGIAHNVHRWNETDLAGYLFLGSTGESVHLEERERDQVIATAREHTPPDKALLVGTGALATERTIRFARRAAELGADAALVVTPFYYKGQMTDEALRCYYWAVADASPIPVLIYNVPVFTALNLAAGTVARLAEHPNIVGLKDSAGDVGQIGEIVRLTSPQFAVFVGASRVLYAALCVGAVGGTLALANVAYRLCTEMIALVEAGQHERARGLQGKITALERAIRHPYSIGGVKVALDLLGYQGGAPRSPLLPADEEARRRIREALEAHGLLTPG